MIEGSGLLLYWGLQLRQDVQTLPLWGFRVHRAELPSISLQSRTKRQGINSAVNTQNIETCQRHLCLNTQHTSDHSPKSHHADAQVKLHDTTTRQTVGFDSGVYHSTYLHGIGTRRGRITNSLILITQEFYWPTPSYCLAKYTQHCEARCTQNGHTPARPAIER